jgi:hypothetical protein
MSRRVAVPLTAAAVAGTLAATALAGTPWRVLARDSDRARTSPVAAAFGEVDDPVRIGMRVLATPRQRATGAWAVTCIKNRDGGLDTIRGKFSARAPFTRTLPFPRFIPTEPDSCQVSVTASVRSGRVTVVILARG